MPPLIRVHVYVRACVRAPRAPLTYTGDPVELFLKDSDDELRNTMIMKLSIALEVEISDLQELSSTELLKRASSPHCKFAPASLELCHPAHKDHI